MTVYVDNMLRLANVTYGGGTVRSRWSHLLADTRDELDEFARRLGERPTWIQHRDTPKEHYDVTESTRDRAIELGAVPIGYGSPEWMAFFARKRRQFGRSCAYCKALVVRASETGATAHIEASDCAYPVIGAWVRLTPERAALLHG